jgi:AcrR family transcriptional regulator
LRTRTARLADRILDAAARLFASHRFHEAKMDDVAALAEVGKGTLYRYFQDKEALYLALLERASPCSNAPPWTSSTGRRAPPRRPPARGGGWSRSPTRC